MQGENIEIYIADIRQKRIKESCEQILKRLSYEEREKAARFLHEEDRLRFITGRLMIRTLAPEKFGIDAPRIRLTEYGKPYISGTDKAHFNISHSGDLVALAISAAPIGVDIERQIPTQWREIAQTFCASERQTLNISSEPLRCFYRIWTEREAFAKAVGEGIPLFDNEQPDIDHDRGIVHYHGETFYLASEEIDDYSLCVCSCTPDCCQ